MKEHLPYNLLLVITVVAIGLMAVFNLTMRQSGFAVRVGYAIPQPPAAAPAEPPMPWAEQGALESAPPPQVQDDAVAENPLAEAPAEPVVLARFPLEINEATYEQLILIPQVGDVTAQRIIQYREHLGGYTHLSQLLDIVGIGPSSFAHITAYLYLADAGEAEEVREEEEAYIQEE